MDISNTLMQMNTADRRPSLLSVDAPIFTGTPVIQRHEEQRGIERTSEDENSTYVRCIFNSMNDLEKEVRETKRDVNYTLELKIDKLKSMLVLMFNNITEKKSYSTIISEMPVNVRDEGHCNSSTASNDTVSSQTHPKTLYQSNNDAKPRPTQDARPQRGGRPQRDEIPRRDDRLQRDGKPLRDKQQQLDGRPKRDERPQRDG